MTGSAIDGRVLVTGASGVLGRPLTAALVAMGHDVHGVARGAAPATGVNMHQADLLEPGTAAALIRDVRPAVLIHLAWITRHPDFWVSPINADWVEVSDELVATAAASGLRRLVGAGSCAEYRWPRDRVSRLEEASRCDPESAYGRAKLQAARAAEALCARTGVSFVWPRYFNLFAPDEPPTKVFRSTVDSLRAGRAPAIATPGARRDFMLMSDAAAITAVLASSAIEGPINVATGRATRVDAFVRQIAVALGTEPDLPMISTYPEGIPPQAVACIGRLRRVIPGFRPRPLPAMIADGVRDLRADSASAALHEPVGAFATAGGWV